MKTIIKEHPLRTIVLDFDLAKQAPDFETKALDAYYEMHDETWEAKKKLQEHKDNLFELDIQLTELEYLLQPIEQQLDFLEVAFKLDEKIKLPMLEDSFTIDIGDFIREVIQHNTAMIDLHPTLAEEWKWFDNWAQFIYDHEDWCTFGQEDLIHEVFRQYEKVSVDIVSLDIDQQEFFGAHGEVRKLQDDYFDYGEQIFGMHDRIKERAEKAYRRAERLQAYIDEHYE